MSGSNSEAKLPEAVDLRFDICRDIEQVLKIGRDFQNKDGYRGAHYDTVKLLCDAIEYQQEQLEAKTEVGDAAKLRQALEAIDKNTDLLDIAENIAPKLHPSHSYVAVQIRKIVRAALAAPPRNCDRGTVDEQAKRMDAYCASHGERIGGSWRCDNCPLCSIHRCELAWAQTPYKEGGAK